MRSRSGFHSGDTSGCLTAQGQGNNVQSGWAPCRRTPGHGLHLGTARGATRQDNLVHVTSVDTAVLHAFLNVPIDFRTWSVLSSSVRTREQIVDTLRTESITMVACVDEDNVRFARRTVSEDGESHASC